MKYFASAYCLRFSSDLPLPEFNPLPDSETEPHDVDVHIRLADVPESLENPTGTGVLYEASPQQFLFTMDGVARYLVSNGNQIHIQPAAGASESDVRVFLLGSVFGALLHQRQHLVLHASAIRTEVGAVLFSGPSGVGKSTVLGELMKRGHPMLVDDVCAIELDEDGLPVVLPGYPRTRLWADSAAKLEISTDGLQRTRAEIEKFECSRPDQYWSQPVNLHTVYSLSVGDLEQVSISESPTLDSFKLVTRNTYRAGFLRGLEMRGSHFALVTSVVENCRVSRLVRPTGSFNLKELADRIEEDVLGGR